MLLQLNYSASSQPIPVLINSEEFFFLIKVLQFYFVYKHHNEIRLGFAAAVLAVVGFLNTSDFVVDVIKDATSLGGALNEVAGFVVGVEEGMTQHVGENKLFKYTIRRQYNT